MIRLIRDLVPANVLTLLITELLLLSSCYVLASYLVLDVDPSVFLLYDRGLERIAVVAASMIGGLYFLDLYTNIRVRSRVLLVQQFCQAMGITFLVEALLSYLDPEWMLPRWLMMTGSCLCLVVLPAWRVFYSAVVLRALLGVRVLFLGGNKLVEDIAAYLSAHPELGFHVLGCVTDRFPVGADIGGAKVLAPHAGLAAVVASTRPDRIVVGLTERRQRLPVQDLLEYRFSGIQIEEAASAYEKLCYRISLRELRPAQLIFTGELGPRPGNVALQTMYSTLIALTGLVVALPFMLLIAAAVKLTSRGPVLFRQQRVGLRGKVFTLFKFRSMYADAEAETGAVWARKDDPRITPVGRWLRRLRLDELPQLFNVLRGEMSMVGPRPERPEFVKTLAEEIPYYRQRHCVKPGVTGWAQINHKYGDTLEDTITKLEYDLYYIKNLSPALDAYIIFHTAKTMLLLRGAQ